ncbi:MAG: NfeD family protein [Pseudomonadota bacterium]
MPWWGWLIIGVFLMAAELGAVDAAFYLIFVGFAAVAVGLLGLAGVEFAVWEQWVLFSAIALTSMYLFRKRLYDKIRGGDLPSLEISEVGELVDIAEDVGPGDQVRVELRGSRWTATNVGDSPIAAGTKAQVIETSGMKLKIVPHTTAQ